MNSGDELYFVLSRVDLSGRARMAELRAEHLEYVLAMRERVQHGGLLAGADGPEAISMVLSATSRD